MRLFVAASCLSFLFGGATSALAGNSRPNVLLIVTDDQGYWDTSIAGNPHIDTPHMDSIAADGVQFKRFYVEPVCAPTRAGLMTGGGCFLPWS